MKLQKHYFLFIFITFTSQAKNFLQLTNFKQGKISHQMYHKIVVEKNSKKVGTPKNLKKYHCT
jgi:hypothetical protein